MVDIKRFVKDIFLFGGGAAAGYTVNELRQRDKRRKLRLGVIGSMGAVYALYMTLNHLGPNYLDYRKNIELMKEKHKYTIDSMRVEKGYDNPEKQIDEFEKQMQDYGKQLNDLAPNLEDRIGKDMEKKLDKKLTQKMNPLYDDQKKILEELSGQKTEQKQESENILDSIVDFFSSDNTKSSPPKSSMMANYSKYVIDIDKSSNTLSLIGSDNKLLYSCPISLAKSGGPPSGDYKVQTIAERDGDLGPGVIKLTDIIVITGPGENNQYETDIMNRVNVNKTGGRLLRPDYEKLTSKIKNKEVVVHIHQ